jgi:hypothetical protein
MKKSNRIPANESALGIRTTGLEAASRMHSTFSSINNLTGSKIRNTINSIP